LPGKNWVLRPLFFLSLLCSRLLAAQVFEVGGGSSSLYQASGGSITIHAPGYDATLGAGLIDGHVLGGARLIKATERGKLIFGDDRINFRLPTDIFDTSHFLLARGAGFAGERGGTDILAFAGATATDYNSPIFDGAKTNDPAGILFLKKRIGPKWQLFSDTIASKKMTEIEAVQWEPRPKLDLGLSAGIGANQPYGSASLNFSRNWIDVESAYIGAGQQFHRVALVSPLLAEPDRGNVLVSIKPRSFLTLTGAHQNYLVPQYPSTDNVRSSVNQGTVALRVLKTSLNATFYDSTYLDSSNHAVSLFAARDITSRVHVLANYFAARPLHAPGNNGFLSTISEALTSRLSVSESVTTSGGHTGIVFGGEFLSNFITASADYQTFYVPAMNNSPFEQALTVDIKMNLFGRLTLHGASFVDPTGHIRYTADASTVLTRGQKNGPLTEHLAVEPAIMRGCVTDTEGRQVEGAALLIDKKLVYTDSAGCFFVRENKPRTHKLEVVLTEFLAGGNWFVVSAPATITSSPEKDHVETPVVIVLTHVRIVGSTSGVVINPAPLK
jgi:hypothetical protein